MWTPLTNPNLEVPKGKILLLKTVNGDVIVHRNDKCFINTLAVVAYTIIDDFVPPIRTLSRWREPRQADLEFGPIDCEVRDSTNEQWVKRELVYVSKHGYPFVTLSNVGRAAEWRHCRIQRFHEKAKWLAKDKTGCWFWYSEKPNLGETIWRSDGNSYSERVYDVNLPDLDWRDSLIELS